jgi:hypothetical protein
MACIDGESYEFFLPALTDVFVGVRRWRVLEWLRHCLVVVCEAGEYCILQILKGGKSPSLSSFRNIGAKMY